MRDLTFALAVMMLAVPGAAAEEPRFRRLTHVARSTTMRESIGRRSGQGVGQGVDYTIPVSGAEEETGKPTFRRAVCDTPVSQAGACSARPE